jgi:hypothetical protein
MNSLDTPDRVTYATIQLNGKSYPFAALDFNFEIEDYDHRFNIQHDRKELNFKVFINKDISFFESLFARTYNFAQTSQMKDCMFSLTAQNYKFDGCFVMKVERLELSFSITVIANEFLMTVGGAVLHSLFFLIETESVNLQPIRKSLDYMISIADGDTTMLSNIEEEVKLYLYDKDEFFDRKLDGNIKWVF